MVTLSAFVPAIRSKSSVTLAAGSHIAEAFAPPGLLRAFHSYPAAIGQMNLILGISKMRSFVHCGLTFGTDRRALRSGA
jgi:hypothetical protein